MAETFLVPYVRTVWRMLGHRFGDTGRICIYGAGRHTRWLLEAVADVEGPVIDCIVDDGGDGSTRGGVASTLGGYPVRRPDDVPADSIDLVLISSDRWESRLASRARAVWGDAVEVMRLYEGLPDGPYDKTDARAEALSMLRNRRRGEDWIPACAGMTERAGMTWHGGMQGRAGMTERGGMQGRAGMTLDAASRQVVFVSDHPRSRELKLATCLARAGWRVVLLHRHDPSFAVDDVFTEAHSYGSAWEALRLACESTPTAYHVFVNSDYRVGELFLKHRPGPIVIDSYDVIQGMYTREYLEDFPEFAAETDRERYCLTRADGLCCRSREVDHVFDSGQTRPRLFLPDGCWNAAAAVDRSQRSEIHVGYVGALTPEGSGKASRYVEGRFLSLARCLCRQDVHVHFHVQSELSSAAFQVAYAPYLELADRAATFHFHRPMQLDRLLGCLREYDFGLFVYNSFLRFEDVDAADPPRGLLHLTEAKIRCCTSNKFFDYLDAELPIIHNARRGSNLASIVKPYGAGIDVGDLPVERWGERLRRVDRAALREGVRAAREAFDIERRRDALIEFYESLCGSWYAHRKSEMSGTERVHAHHR